MRIWVNQGIDTFLEFLFHENAKDNATPNFEARIYQPVSLAPKIVLTAMT
jgi:hypothetical protein